MASKDILKQKPALDVLFSVLVLFEQKQLNRENAKQMLQSKNIMQKLRSFDVKKIKFETLMNLA